jgi:hypothetical protein
MDLGPCSRGGARSSLAPGYCLVIPAGYRRWLASARIEASDEVSDVAEPLSLHRQAVHSQL